MRIFFEDFGPSPPFDFIDGTELAAYIPGVERENGNMDGFKVPDMTAASKLLSAIEAIKP